MSNTNNSSNKGVQISGGSINVRDMAVGDNASIQSTNHIDGNQQLDLRQELETLIALMKESSVDEDKIAAAELAKTELEKEKPNAVVVNSVLESVIASIKDISALSASIASISTIIFG